MNERYDAVVVGAGPAGSVTALLLARAGRRVALVDRHVFPRPKPCGDCLSPEAARVLDRLGLLERVYALAPARLKGWRIVAPDGHAFRGTFEHAARGDERVRHALAVSRERLDAVLVDAARDAGAELIAPLRIDALVVERGRVIGVRAGTGAQSVRRIDARLVVGADGLRSVVARRAGAVPPPGRLRKFSLTAHPRLSAGFTNGDGEMHVVPGGCIGIAPVEDAALAEHNVTFVASGRPVRSGDGVHATMAALIAAAPGLRDRSAALLDALGDARPLASGPFDRPVRFTTRDGLALVGDAAGYYDPFTGQGVFQALSAGEYLAGIAEGALRETPGIVRASQLKPYATWLKRARRPTRAVQRLIEQVTARPHLMNRWTRLIDDAAPFADALVAVTGDLVPVRTLAGEPLLSLGGALIRTAARRNA